MTSDALTIFTGNANPALAEAVAKQMKLQLGKAFVGRFSDGEIQVEIQENVRGKNVVVIQSTCVPTNDNLMELMIMIDALKRASANRITAVIPYFGYARKIVAHALHALPYQPVLWLICSNRLPVLKGS